MPCYQLILFAKPETSPEKLSTLFRSLARLVYREQGQFRTIENLGVRPLAYPIRQAGRKVEQVRWVQAMYDCAPPALASVGTLLASDTDVLQFKHLKQDDGLGRFKPERKERLKKFSPAQRFTKELFDPETLALGPRVAVQTPEMR